MSGGPPHALLVTVHFPPDRGPATHRVLRFATHLRSAGWAVTVLTISEDAYRHGTPTDHALLERLPVGVRVVRTTVRRPVERLAAWRARWRGRGRRHGVPGSASVGGTAATKHGMRAGGLAAVLTDVLSLPDRDVGWYGPAVAAGRRVLAERRVDVVVSTAPPFTAHLVGQRLGRLAGAPWIADFRDPWSRAPWALEKRTTSWQGWIHRTLERRTVYGASRVVLNTARMRDDFVGHYRDTRPDHFVALPNGYDREVLRIIDDVGPPASGPVTLTHAGTLYGARNPAVLFRAMRQLLDSGHLKEGSLRVQLLGAVSGSFGARGMVESLHLERFVSFLAPVPHAEALRTLASSDALLLFQQGTDLQVPAKLYEYVGLRRPIIAVAPRPSAVADVVEGTGLGVVVLPDDVDGLASALDRIAHGEALAAPNGTAIAAYDGEALGRQFVGLLQAVRRDG